ncbi:TPA: plasmid replication protein RepB [Aeromonas salmonicida subsp. pectinolytica]
MQELQAKWTFDQGGFSKALIVPTPMGAGYHLHLVKFGRQAETEVIERQRGGWRVFSTIDAAANTANGIGFRRIEIDLSSR